MGISGDQPALMYSRASSASGTGTGLLRPARAGATRLGYEPPTLLLTVAGTARHFNFDRETWSVSERKSDQPNTLTIDVFGFTPVLGNEIVFERGGPGNRIFRGSIVRLSKIHTRKNEGRTVYRLSCLDWMYQLQGILVTKGYGSQSATTTLLDLLSTYAPSGFTTTTYVETGLATIDEIQFTMIPLPQAVKQVLDRIGGYAYWDFNKALHAFTTAENIIGPEAISVSNRHVRAFHYDQDIEGVRNRILVEGLGASVRAPIAPGGTTIPVDDASMFETGGGTNYAKLEAQIISYTGVASASKTGSVLGVPLAAPAQITSVSAGGGSGSMSSLSAFDYAVVYQTARGTTTAGSSQGGTSSATGTMSISGIPVPSSSTVIAKYLYRTGAGGGTLKLHHQLTMDQTSYDDFMADGQLGGNAPSTNTAIVEGVIAAGSTSVNVEDCAPFNAGGGWAEGPGGQVFSYTGRSVSSGAGNLTGIPASGLGSLTAALRSGTVKAIPHLTGVPASGDGAIAQTLVPGESVNLLILAEDGTSQTAYGVRGLAIQDRRLSLAGAADRAAAVLALLKDPHTTGTYRSTDGKTHIGRPLAISMAADWGIDVTVRVEGVSWKPVKGQLYPEADVTFGSRTIDDLFAALREIKERALIR